MAANLITDVEGVLVGSAHDERLASGVTVVLFEEPSVASIAINGGAPALRDAALLEPEMTIERVDGFVLSGGSAFGLDAAGGAMAYLAEIGRGFEHRGARVPIVPGASLFDLLNGGDKSWGRKPPYWDMGLTAASTAAVDFALGAAGAGFGATTYNLKGGLGSASAVTSSGFRVGALVAVNSVGRATRGESLHFWAAPYEQHAEFGGLGFGPKDIDDHLTPSPQIRHALQHGSYGRRHRRGVDHDAAQANRDHGSGRLRACAASRPCANGQRRRLRGGDGAGWRGSGHPRPDRDWNVGRRMRCSSDRARGLRGLPALAAGSATVVAAALGDASDRRVNLRRSSAPGRRL